MPVLLRKSGLWVPVDGSSVALPATRDDSLIGTVQPSALNTGWSPSLISTPGQSGALVPYNAESTDRVVLSSGQIIKDSIIYGDVRPPTDGSDAWIINCELVGGSDNPGGTTGVINCTPTRGGTGRLHVWDSTLHARVPRLRDGIVGYRYDLKRCHIYNVRDGWGSFVTSGQGSSVFNDVRGNYVHRNVWSFPDYQNGVSGAIYNTSSQYPLGDGAHTDGGQHQGGNRLWVQGNYFDLSDSVPLDSSMINPRKEWLTSLYARDGVMWANGACVIIQNSTGNPTDATVIVEQNWFKGGLSHVNIKSTATGWILRNNRHYRDSAARPSNWASLPNNSGDSTRNENLSAYAIRGDSKSASSITGVNTGTVTDTYVDGPYAGATLAEPRDLGISWDAA